MTDPRDNFELIYSEYFSTRRNQGIQKWKWHLFLWFGSVVPGVILNINVSQFRMLGWMIFAAIMLNWGGRHFFGPILFDMHKKLLPLVDSEYAEDYYIDSIKILKPIFIGFGSEPKKGRFLEIQKKQLGIQTSCILWFSLILALVENPLLWYLLLSIKICFYLIGLGLFFINFVPIVLMVFGNMKVLHHLTFWKYQAHNIAGSNGSTESKKLRFRLIGELMIMANLYVSITIVAFSMLLAAIWLCFAVLIYSSTFPDKYYEHIPPKIRYLNRLNAVVNVGPFLLVSIFYIFWPNPTAYYVGFITLLKPVYAVYMPAAIIVEIGIVYVWNNFLMGKFTLPSDFTQKPFLFVPLSKKYLKITLSRLILFGVFAGFSIFVLIEVLVFSILLRMLIPALFWIIGFIIACFIITRGVLHSISELSKTEAQIGELMYKYTWPHKRDELRVHFWEFMNSPTGILFPGVFIFPIFLIVERVYRARTFFILFPEPFKAITMAWFLICIGMIIYILGVVVFYSILAPHFVWHAAALTTIPLKEIESIKKNPLFKDFRSQFRSITEWGYVGLPILLLLYLPTVTGVYTNLVIDSIIIWILGLGVIYLVIYIFVPRFLNRVLVPIERRESEIIRSEYLQYPKNKKA